MRFSEFLESLMDEPDALYNKVLDDMAGAILAISEIHKKPLEEIGRDLNAKVQELKEAEDAE
jgi:hypothetical protein